MPLSHTHPPRTHRARGRRRHAGAAPNAGRRAVRRVPLLIPATGRPRRGPRYAVGAALVLTLAVAARAGALTRLWEFLDFGSGVLALVSLSATVLWGLVATDRTVLGSGHRLLAQGVHRALAVGGLGFLALHVWVKIAEGQTGAASAVLPFADPDRPFLIGLGTLAGYLFVAVAASGALRSAFATRSRSLWWRVLHMGAYPAWGMSLVHGLKSGRPAAGWVTVSYALCLAGVAAVIALRVRARRRRAAVRPAEPPLPQWPPADPAARPAAPAPAPGRNPAPRPPGPRREAPYPYLVPDGGGRP
ncbi:hypothetical protein [Streptomyces sp. NPDC089919]|uniref:hypothetical protein n=1 Tax=Streptomyces sp. NPDC089919 TaxID=3155188 RepID=UPI0034283333